MSIPDTSIVLIRDNPKVLEIHHNSSLLVTFDSDGVKLYDRYSFDDASGYYRYKSASSDLYANITLDALENSPDFPDLYTGNIKIDFDGYSLLFMNDKYVEYNTFAIESPTRLSLMGRIMGRTNVDAIEGFLNALSTEYTHRSRKVFDNSPLLAKLKRKRELSKNKNERVIRGLKQQARSDFFKKLDEAAEEDLSTLKIWQTDDPYVCEFILENIPELRSEGLVINIDKERIGGDDYLFITVSGW